MSYFESRIAKLKERREKVLSGKFNCIPFPFPRFKNYVPGVEQGKYIIVTASQKIGKSKFSDYVFVYEPLFFALEHPEFKIKVLYFSLEMSYDAKYDEFLCHLLNRLDNIVISPTDLRSTDKEKPVDPRIFELLESERYRTYINKFEEIVEFYDNIKNPTGINKKCREYADSHGHYNYITIDTVDANTKQVIKKQILDPHNPYTPDDPDEYRIVILDNASNLTAESGMKKMDNIDKMSKYAISLRNQLNYIFVLIQHQAQAQEGIENFKLNKIKPSSDGLADCKTTTRDANMVIGLYSPYKYGMDSYEGYDIKKLKNYSRFMEIIEDRDYGAGNHICPLFFNGASSTFHELPLPDDNEGIRKVYGYINSIENEKKSSNKLFLMFKKIFKKKVNE